MNVVKRAAFSCACFSLFAIVCLNLLILILSSCPNLIFLSEGFGDFDIKFIKSPFRIWPSFPDPRIDFKSILFSATIFLTDGESVFDKLFFLEPFVGISSVRTKGSSSKDVSSSTSSSNSKGLTSSTIFSTFFSGGSFTCSILTSGFIFFIS